MKITRILIVALALILLFGFVAYLGWRMITSVPAVNQEPEETAGEGSASAVPTVPEAPPLLPQSDIQLVKMSNEAGIGFAVLPESGEVYYLTPLGKVINAKEGSDVPLSSQEIGEIQSVEVSSNSERILVSFGEKERPQWGVFDIIDGVWRPLQSSVRYAAWGAGESALLAILEEGANRPLVSFDVSELNKKPRVLLRHFGLYDVTLTALTPQRIIVSEIPSFSYPGRVWQLNPEKSALQLVLAPRPGFTLWWSEDKKTAFAFTPPGAFSVLDDQFREIVPVVFTTLPAKCARSPESLYCFAPQTIPSNIQLPDDYFQKRFFSLDELLVVDINSLSTEKPLISGVNGVPPLDAEYVRYADGALYFLNRYDGGVYRIKIKD